VDDLQLYIGSKAVFTLLAASLAISIHVKQQSGHRLHHHHHLWSEIVSVSSFDR